jgi:DNA (cytosine-5)-methyltransferase 1
MSWHYMQGQEAASWQPSCLDGAPSALLRLIPSAEGFCSPDRETESCQGSQVGKRKAAEDDRNLWPETVRIIREVRPDHLLLENVPGLLARSHGYMHSILGQLAESGYDCQWDCIPASALGANHRRDRLWIVAHHHSAVLRDESGRVGRKNGKGQDVPAINGEGPWGITQPDICGAYDGMADRLDRLRSLGNGQVPAVASLAWRRLKKSAQG